MLPKKEKTTKVDLKQFKRMYALHLIFLQNMDIKLSGEQLMRSLMASTGEEISDRTLKKTVMAMRRDLNLPLLDKGYQYKEPCSFLQIFELNRDDILRELGGLLKFAEKSQLFVGFNIREDINRLLKILTEVNQPRPTIFFDKIEKYTGFEKIERLHVHILRKNVLTIYYTDFYGNTSDMIFHPYFLKEYNNRWYLYGYDPDAKKIKQLGLERIREISKKTHVAFIEMGDKINPETYFDVMYGISKKPNQLAEEVNILVHKAVIPYFETKPIHATQKIDYNSRKDEFRSVSYKIIINPEFKGFLKQWGADLIVLEPTSLAKEMYDDAQKKIERYLELSRNEQENE